MASNLIIAPIQNEGMNCWKHCQKRQGPCSWCGAQGMCCTQKPGWSDMSNGCDGTFGGRKAHECALTGTLTMLHISIYLIGY